MGKIEWMYRKNPIDWARIELQNEGQSFQLVVSIDGQTRSTVHDISRLAEMMQNLFRDGFRLESK